MIDYIYVDNYRCFSNFEFRPKKSELILGDNGTGKSFLFALIAQIRDFITDGSITTKDFHQDTLTAWDSKLEQQFELGLKNGDDKYKYQLIIQHNKTEDINRIKSETVTMNDLLIYSSSGDEIHLYNDGHKLGVTFPFDWTRSFLPNIPERPDNTKLTWFKKQISNIYHFNPDPISYEMESHSEVEKPDADLANLVSWIRHLSLESVITISDVMGDLKESIDGLVSLSWKNHQTKRVNFHLSFKAHQNRIIHHT